MMGRQTTLLLILLFTPLLLAAEVTLTADAQTTCATVDGCDFNTASIWSTGVIPTNNDTVTISGASGLQIVHITTSNPTAVAALSLSNALFTVSKDIINITLSLSVGVNATLVISETTNVHNVLPVTGMLYVDNTATLTVNGNLQWEASAEIYGTVTYGANSQVFIFSLTLKPSSTSAFNSLFYFGFLIIPDHTTITFAGGFYGTNTTIQNTSTVTIQKSISLRSLSIDTASAVHILNVPAGGASIVGDAPPIVGAGSLILDASSVVITSFAPATFNGTVTLNGASTLNVTNVTISNPLTFGGGAAVTIYANNLNIGGVVNIPGSIVATGQGVTISGAVTANGVSAVSSAVSVTGSLFIPSTFNIALTNSTLSLGGFLRIDTLDIPVGSTLTIISSKAILVIPSSVSLIIEGTLSASSSNILQIENGNYYQTSTGTLAVGVTDDSTAPLNVPNGTISIAGSLQYSLSDKPFVRTEHFLVASANSNTTVNGTFNGDASPLPGSALDRNLGVEYSGNNIYVKYTFNVEDVEYWMWIVLGVGVVVIVGAIAGIVMKLRTRAKYEPVR